MKLKDEILLALKSDAFAQNDPNLDRIAQIAADVTDKHGARGLAVETILSQRGKLGAVLIQMMSFAGTPRQEEIKAKANAILNEISFSMAEANESGVDLKSRDRRIIEQIIDLIQKSSDGHVAAAENTTDKLELYGHQTAVLVLGRIILDIQRSYADIAAKVASTEAGATERVKEFGEWLWQVKLDYQNAGAYTQMETVLYVADEYLKKFGITEPQLPAPTDDGAGRDTRLVVWSKTPPTGQGMYWNWNGDYDSAPFPLHVLYSGFSRKCFVSAGQGGIQSAIDCDQFGGWWKPLIEEPIPTRSEIDAMEATT